MSADRLKPLHRSGLATEPMSHETTEMFIRLSLAEKGNPVHRSFAELRDHLGPQACSVPQMTIILGRIALAADHASDLRFTAETILFVGMLSGNPGALVAYAHTLVEIARERPCDMWALALAFPNGFPTRDALHDYWDAQKAGVGNKLDQAETWMPATVAA